MTSPILAVIYGNERINTITIITGLSFGGSTFRNLQFVLVWYLL